MATEIRATVFTVDEVKPHPNADRLELVEALGWQVVTGKGLRKPGEKCVYIQPDSIVPDEWSEKWGVKQYLKGSDHNRVGQIRLRGEPSFGFIVEAADPNWEDGKNVAQFYGITKYEPPVKMGCGDAASPHELFPKYTDIENLRNFPDVFEEGEEVIATEKIHGCIHKDTKVMLANGEERFVSEIEKGDMILSFSEDEQDFVPSEVLDVLIQEPTDKLEWFDLELDNGRTITCTEDHPILTSEGWVQAKDLTENHEIISVS